MPEGDVASSATFEGHVMLKQVAGHGDSFPEGDVLDLFLGFSCHVSFLEPYLFFRSFDIISCGESISLHRHFVKRAKLKVWRSMVPTPPLSLAYTLGPIKPGEIYD